MHRLAVHFKLTWDMISVVLYQYLNCATGRTIEVGHTASNDCNY